MSLPVEYVAWLAGYFDGEGSISLGYYVTKKGVRRVKNIKLSIGQSGDRGLVIAKELQNIFGGHIAQNQQHHWQPCYVWGITSRKAVLDFLKLISPFLRVRISEIGEKIAIIERWQEQGRYNIWTSEELEKLKEIESSRSGHNGKSIRIYSQKEWERLFPRHTYPSIRVTRRKLWLSKQLNKCSTDMLIESVKQ